MGKVEPGGSFTRRAVADLPEDPPLAVRAYLVWLYVILWKRESSAGGATAQPQGVGEAAVSKGLFLAATSESLLDSLKYLREVVYLFRAPTSHNM